MKLTFWSETVPPSLSGVSTFFNLLWPGLRDFGCELALVTRSEGLSGPAIPDLPPPPPWLAQLRLPFYEVLRRPDVQGLARLRRQLGDFWRQHPPELVHICSLSHPSLYFLLPLLGSTPLLLSMHDDHEEADFSGETLAHRLLRRADRIQCCSQHLAEHLIARCPWVQDRIEVVYHGVLLPEHLPPRQGPVHLLYAGRLAAEKGVDVLLRAMPVILAGHPETHLYLAGDGPLRQALEQLADDMGMTTSVTWLGTLSPQELQRRMEQASLLVVPSRREPLGMVALEAARLALPMVAARVGGLQEIVHHEVTGLVVDPDDPHELADAICALLASPERRQQMGRAARERIATHFHLDDMLARHHRAYQELRR